MLCNHFFVKIIERIGKPRAFKELVLFILFKLQYCWLFRPPDVIQINCRHQVSRMVSGFVLNQRINYVKLTDFFLLQNVKIVGHAFFIFCKFPDKNFKSFAHQIFFELFSDHIFQLVWHFFIDWVKLSSLQNPVFCPKNFHLVILIQSVSFYNVLILDIGPKTDPKVFLEQLRTQKPHFSWPLFFEFSVDDFLHFH